MIEDIESLIGDPSKGLPEEVFLFLSRVTPMINVDLLIQDEGKGTLLTWRDDGYFPAGWHIPGGIIRYKETFADRIHAVALQELGTRVSFSPEPIAVSQIIHPTRKNRGHFISLLYACHLEGAPAEELAFRGQNPHPGQWAWHQKGPHDLIEVHEIYRRFLG